jgi:hypothetical protein
MNISQSGVHILSPDYDTFYYDKSFVNDWDLYKFVERQPIQKIKPFAK